MKMVVAYIDHEVFEPIREELLGLGFASLSILEAHGSGPQIGATATYRGTEVTNHVRSKVRVECVVGASHVPTVVETLLKHEGKRTFVCVLPVEEAHPMDSVNADPATVAAGA
jgi:nitrogen regulatory protein PII